MKKVRPGDKLRDTAESFNTVIDLKKFMEGMQPRTGERPIHGFPPSQTIVRVQNTSGAAVNRFGVLGIDGPIFTYVENPQQFDNEVVLNGVEPTIADHTGLFVVCLEPIATNRIGRAVIDGACVALVNMTSATDRFADVKDGDATCLQAGSGSARILYAEPLDVEAEEEYPIIKKAYVQLGVSAPSAVKFGKATASWASGNTVTLTPVVSSTDSTPTGEANIAATIFSPAGTPANVQISINNVVAYVTAPDGTYWVLNPNHGSFTSLGTLQYQVYQMTTTTVAGWDFVRASA